MMIFFDGTVPLAWCTHKFLQYILTDWSDWNVWQLPCARKTAFPLPGLKAFGRQERSLSKLTWCFYSPTCHR